MTPRRAYVGHRSLILHKVFFGARLVIFVGLALLSAVGQWMVTFAQGFLVVGVLVLVFDLLEWALPGKLLPRATAATLGEDGVQTPEGFIGWHRVRQIREVVSMETAEQRRAREQEERAARKEKRVPRHPRRLRYAVFDLHDDEGWRTPSAKPRDVRGFIEEANARLARRRRPEAEPKAPGYRGSAEPVHAHPRDAALDTALPPPERVAAFLQLEPALRRDVLAAMADDEGREVFTRRGADGS